MDNSPQPNTDDTSMMILIEALERKSAGLYAVLDGIVNDNNQISKDARNSKESIDTLISKIRELDTNAIQRILNIALK